MGKVDTRPRILTAAAEEFAEKGYGGATTRSIARRAGINEVTLFRHFGSKLELLNGVLTEVPERPVLEEAVSSGLTGLEPREALVRLARLWANVMKPRAAWLYLRLAKQAGVEPPQHLKSLGMSVRLAGYIKAEQDEGRFRASLDPEHAAMAFLAGISGFVIAQDVLYTDRQAPSVDAFIETYVDLFLRGVEV